MVRLRDSWPFSLSSAPTVGNPCRPLQPESESDSLEANRRFAMRPGIALRPDYDAAQLWALAKATRDAGQSGFGAQFGWWAQSGRWTRFQAMRCNTGIPSRVIRLSTAQPTRASVFWAGRDRARRPRPIRAL